MEPTGEAMREILGEAVDFIRFPTMSLQDFAQKVVPSEILTADDALEMHQYFSRVIPSPNIKFPYTYRAWITSDPPLHQCNLYPTYGNLLESNILRSNIWRCEVDLKFVVEPRNIHLKGVRLFAGSKEYQSCYAEVRLLDENGDELTAKVGTFKGNVKVRSEHKKDFYGYDVIFEVPVLIWRSSKYTIQVQNLKGGETEICTERLAVVEENGVYFNFQGYSRHIYQLLFHKN